MDKSPRIVNISWGGMEVEGYGKGRDFILWPGGAELWDWNRSGTSHDSIALADVEKALANGAEIVILSTGVFGRLKITDEVTSFLCDRGVEFEILKTGEAVKRYNQLREVRLVGGLFHSTC
jgi:hypothetical protein